MANSSNPTLGRAVGRLGLRLAPFVIAYWGGIIVVGTRLEGWTQGLFLISALIPLVFLLTHVGRLLVYVPPNQSLVLIERNRSEPELLLPGYHLLSPLIYRNLGSINISSTNYEMILHNVTLRNSPTLSLQIRYTVQPCVPLGMERLRRTKITNQQVQLEQQFLANVVSALRQPEAWDQACQTAIESGLRDFFSQKAGKQIYDPAGTSQMPLGQLLTQANTYLRAAVEPQLGYQIRAHTIALVAVPPSAKQNRAQPFVWGYGFPTGQGYNVPPKGWPSQTAAGPQPTGHNSRNGRE